MAAAPRLVEIQCPECGHRQLEPALAISTYCRQCSTHIAIGAEPRPHPKPRARPALRTVHCYTCGQAHETARDALETLCPHCGAAISLRDMDVAGVSARPVDIRGRLAIPAGSRLSTPRMVCEAAWIEGQAHGALFCAGEARLAACATLSLAVYARSLIIEKDARLALASPCLAGTAEIRGSLEGWLFAAGRVRIRKGGAFRGILHARALEIERGAMLLSETVIGPAGPCEPPALPSHIRPPPGWLEPRQITGN